MDLFSSQEMLHDEAIYIHGGQQYHVDRLDWERRKAFVKPVAVDYYTDAQRKSELKTLTAEEKRPDAIGAVEVGEIGLVSTVPVFKKIKLGTHENVGSGRVHLPEMEMHTTSFWWELPEELQTDAAAAGLDLGDALQGLAHLFGTVAPVFVMADLSDLRAQAMVRSPFTACPTLYIYDAVPGGVGFARRIYGQFDEIRDAAREHLLACACERGCPACVGAVAAGGGGAKAGAAWLLALSNGETERNGTRRRALAAGAGAATAALAPEDPERRDSV
jgi:DEAD/DEAH box helicase domain-containing protein